MANLTVARHFGVDVDEQQLHAISKYLVNGAVSPVPEYQRLLAQTQELADERRFFHWQLETPEVFLDQQRQMPEDEAGFDVVVGNPPYGSIPDDDVKDWVRQQYQSSGTTLDTFATFLERATQLATARGAIGEIVPSGWLTAREHLPLRTVLLSQTRPKVIVHMPYDVFPDAYIDTIVWVVEKSEAGRPSEPLEVLVKRFGHREKVEWMPQRSKDYQVVNGSEWLLDPQMLIVTDKGPGQWLGKWARLPHFMSAGEFLSVSRGITPFVEPKPGEIRSTALGFFGSVGRYALESEKLTPVVYDPSLMEYKPIEFFTGPRLIIRRIISRQRRIHATLVTENFVINKSYLPAIAITDEYALAYILAILNSKLLSRSFVARSEIAKRDDFPQLDIATVREFPIRRIDFTTPADIRTALLNKGQRLYDIGMDKDDQDCVLGFVEHQLSQEPQQADVVYDLLAYLAQQMIDLNKERQRLEREADLFRFVERETPCLRLDKALGGPLGAGEVTGDLSVIRHDIEGLRLSREEDGRWLLEVRGKLRDQESGWREHQRDKTGKFIRQWLPVYRLSLDEAMGRFYHYAFAHLRGFVGAGKFPGGFTRSTLEKLKATKVPKFVPVDLAPLAALEVELAEVRRKICLTDDLIDQIVYKLYGLTEEEIAIVEGRA